MRIQKKTEVLQSYLFTMAKYNYGVYEKRVLYRIVEICQMQLKGQKLDHNFRIDPALFGDHIVTMPITKLLKSENDMNHDTLEKALTKLRNKTFEIRTKDSWQLVGIIEKPKLNRKMINGKECGNVTFELQPPIYEAIMSFSKSINTKGGFRKYELETAFNLSSTYAMRFYEMFSNQFEPKIMYVNDLRNMFGLNGKYDNFSNFVKKVIISSQKELDKKAPYSFDFNYDSPDCKQGRKVIKIKFIPRKTDKHTDDVVIIKQAKAEELVDPSLVAYLKNQFGFKDEEIKRHFEALNQANVKFSVVDFINNDVSQRLSDIKNVKGYIIRSIKSRLKQIS